MLPRHYRIAVGGSFIELLIAYPILISAEVADILPAHFTWFSILFGPLILFGWLIGSMSFALVLQKRRERQESSLTKIPSE